MSTKPNILPVWTANEKILVKFHVILSKFVCVNALDVLHIILMITIIEYDVGFNNFLTIMHSYIKLPTIPFDTYFIPIDIFYSIHFKYDQLNITETNKNSNPQKHGLIANNVQMAAVRK